MDDLDAAFCLLAAFRGEESTRGIVGGVLIAEMLRTVRDWRKANTKK